MGSSEHFDDGPAEAERLAEEGAEERRRLKAAAKFLLFAVCAAALVFASWQGFLVVRHYALDYRRVPDVAAAGLAGAAEVAERGGWRTEVVDVYQGDPGEFPVGSLLRQEPTPGT